MYFDTFFGCSIGLIVAEELPKDPRRFLVALPPAEGDGDDDDNVIDASGSVRLDNDGEFSPCEEEEEADFCDGSVRTAVSEIFGEILSNFFRTLSVMGESVRIICMPLPDDFFKFVPASTISEMGDNGIGFG